jgi:hypothetical protein
MAENGQHVNPKSVARLCPIPGNLSRRCKRAMARRKLKESSYVQWHPRDVEVAPNVWKPSLDDVVRDFLKKLEHSRHYTEAQLMQIMSMARTTFRSKYHDVAPFKFDEFWGVCLELGQQPHEVLASHTSFLLADEPPEIDPISPRLKPVIEAAQSAGVLDQLRKILTATGSLESAHRALDAVTLGARQGEAKGASTRRQARRVPRGKSGKTATARGDQNRS